MYRQSLQNTCKEQLILIDMYRQSLQNTCKEQLILINMYRQRKYELDPHQGPVAPTSLNFK